MVDRGDRGSDCDEMSSKTPDRALGDGTLNQAAKTCADCGTTKTPLWRGGPAGPKSLCNACGIRSRKRRRALMGLSNKEEKKPKKNNNSNTSTVTTSDGSSSNNSEEEGTNNNNNKTGDSSKKKIVGLGSEFVLQRPRSTMFKQRRKLGEEEQAAMLLMAMSCGSIFA